MLFFKKFSHLSIALILVIWTVAALCAVYLPPDVAHDIGLINPIPFIWKSLSGWRGFLKSDFPEISSIYYSIIWTTFPLFFSLIWNWLKKSMRDNATGLLAKPILGFSDKILIIFSIPIFMLLTYGIAIGNEGQGLRYLELGKSKVDLAIFGIIAPAVAAISLAIVTFGTSRILGFGENND